MSRRPKAPHDILYGALLQGRGARASFLEEKAGEGRGASRGAVSALAHQDSGWPREMSGRQTT